MAPTYLYTACLLGALGLYLIVRSWPGDETGGAARSRAWGMRTLGVVLALGSVAYLFVQAVDLLGALDGDERPRTLFVIFSLIALASAVRMITHRRPVYAALYFVLVVLASAGLFLLMEAEFMAFALIIVYAGAILITYMFVLMLAQQAPSADDPRGQPEYDLNPRDPAVGCFVGFILLALLSRMIFDGALTLPAPPPPAEARVDAWLELQRMPGRLEEYVAREVDGPFTLETAEVNGAMVPRLSVAADGLTATVYAARPGGETVAVALPPEARPENVERIGLALVSKDRFPMSLELAGVILLMAMLGAVILARRQIELTEDEKREAGGLRRLGHHDEPDADAARAGGAT